MLKALAHPLRLRLYELLTARGPATASQLAEHVDEVAGLVSYHLHQLGRHGFVEEAPELGKDGRERWWRVVPGGFSWSSADFLGDPGSRAVAESAERLLLSRQLDRLQQYSAGKDAWGPDWVDAAVGTDALFELTPDELRQLVCRAAGRDLALVAPDRRRGRPGPGRRLLLPARVPVRPVSVDQRVAPGAGSGGRLLAAVPRLPGRAHVCPWSATPSG